MGGGKGLFVYTWCMFCVFIYVLTLYIVYLGFIFFACKFEKKRKNNLKRKHRKETCKTQWISIKGFNSNLWSCLFSSTCTNQQYYHLQNHKLVMELLFFYFSFGDVAFQLEYFVILL